MTDDAEQRRVTIRLSSDDMARVSALVLGDETLSQTVRRVIREAAQRAGERTAAAVRGRK